MKRAAALLATAALALAGCATSSTTRPDPSNDGRAVVIVSGGAAVSPFTTPEAACASGLAAGNTDTALRSFLLEQGFRVFTSPAMAGPGPVSDQSGFGAFGDCPITLPDLMTVNSLGDIDLAGERLARFLTYLHTEYGVDTIDVVGHSMGGLFSRAAFRVLQGTGAPVAIRSLTTLGTPWQGAFLDDYAVGEIPLPVCAGDAFCERSMKEFKKVVAADPYGAATEVNYDYLMDPDGWNAQQGDVLGDIPVTLIAGDVFRGDGPSRVWPNDGIVAKNSGLAVRVPDEVLPHRRCLTFPVTHSIFVSEAAGLTWETGMTWSPEVHAAVKASIDGAAGDQPNRQGCPA